MLRTTELDYELPEDRVATSPAEPRDSARLLVLKRREPGFMEHRQVRDLAEFLRRGDALVVNTTRVIPARFVGLRADTGGKVDGLFLGKQGESAGAAPAWAGTHAGERAGGEVWRVMLKGRRMKPGAEVTVFSRGGEPAGEGAAEDSGVRLQLLEREQDAGDEGAGGTGGAGAWLVRVAGARAGESSLEVLERIGTTPLPPYIRSARKRHEQAADQSIDPARYQTVYAKADQGGSVAAPTAGLHFTPDLLERLSAGGVRRGEVTLHVGAGTFKPVESEFVKQHPMHAEWCRVPADTGALIGGTRGSGGRVIAVGTTSARTLESFATERLTTGVCEGWTNLLITPGFAWKNLDGMLTNFHLPRTTLMAMIAALLDGRSGGAGDGVARLKAAYGEAIARGYRFYSYGDAMLILP